ncbi:Molybdopterin or thiamine biosynthesis adenylyltransferase [Poseidonocella pacifica]|uniref:Molybdopterin or thiamine biosynthesis adenylyltransferase n=1 Tax=Poseidonocella pacifica TaxID=871651 RepID=A0A1I0YFY3_9RHOB|nr:HesA/MoeB/ThiF family protein [Poseidonocella pacifica]SFB11420.1 Molybdopterin or thiamine biosynthesis adenylyltransferase [Poseidonocella pacifica]
MNRYLRQNAVPGYGGDVQAKLAAAHVVVIGAGGLAAPVLPYLAGAGIGHVTIVDPDHVELSNLHRQVHFREEDIGQPKAKAAARHLLALNSGIRISPVVARLDPSNAGAFIGGASLILDCADSFAASYTLSDACHSLARPLISASVIGTEGYAGGFCGGSPSLRAVFPDLPDTWGTCAESGVLGPVVGMIGALQAQMALAALAGAAPSPLGQLVTLDARTYRYGGFRFDGAPEPDTAFRFIAPGTLQDRDWIIDLRRPDEGPLAAPRARRAGVQELTDMTPPDGARAVLACRSGLRAWQAASRLAAHWHGEIALVALGDTTHTGGDPE